MWRLWPVFMAVRLTWSTQYGALIRFRRRLAVLWDAEQETGGDVRRDADSGEDIRVRAIDALLPIGDTAVVNADPRCKLLLTQMDFFPIFSDPTTDLVFHTVTAFSSDTGKNGNSN